jgi:cytochrome c553
MTPFSGWSPKDWVVASAMLIAGLVAVALAVAATGVYNVAASRGHPPWLHAFLELGMRRSVALHSRGIESPPLTSRDLVRLGAGHYHAGCGHCHGVPGQDGNPVYEQMLPAPPKLEDKVSAWRAEELYWIVRHGLQYAGMPAWSGEGRDDEIWAVVAFLQVLPGLDAAAYRDLAAGNQSRVTVSPAQLAQSGSAALRLTACARCHDTQDAPPTGAYVPKLGGQSERYLAEALRQYRAGSRESGIMEPVAAELDDEEIVEMARHYAAVDSPPVVPVTDSAGLGPGRRLAREGDPAADIPPCDACHAANALASYPRLAGLSAEYQIGQLRLWQQGGRAATPAGRTMAAIAGRLSETEIRDVSAHYAGQSR